MDTTQEEKTAVAVAPEGVQTPEPETTPTVSKKNLCSTLCSPTMIAIAVGIILILGAGYYAYTAFYKGGGVVAVVNGTKIYSTEYEEGVALMQQNATQQGADLSDESIVSQIRSQVLEGLIDNTLILSAAKASGITATDEAIQAKYDELVQELGSQEELTKRMGEIGLTEEKLRSNIKDRILADAYTEAETDIETVTVSDEEVNEFVKKISEGGMELPPLEEIRPQIEAEITAQKKQEIVLSLLEKLRSEADIEKRI